MRSLDAAALDCLAALADEGAFEPAAVRLAITQSAVSQRLRSLEQQVGRPLVIRSRPLRLTAAGRVLLRFARQMQAMRADVGRELDALGTADLLPIAVNADSLATWLPAALDPIVQEGLAAGFGLELIVDDQDFTHELLRQGAVLGCVSSVSQPLRGCLVRSLGSMRYMAVASPDFVRDRLGNGLGPHNVLTAPFLVFNRKDDLQAEWVSQAFGLASPRLLERHVPSSEAYANAAAMGWGIGILPELQARERLRAGALLDLRPDRRLEVPLYWHQWKLGRDLAGPSTALLDRVGAALAAGAQAAFTR